MNVFKKTSKIQALEFAKVKSETLSERDALNLTIKSMEEQALPCPSVVQEQQAEDYNKLLEAYNQYVESYKKLSDESMKLAAQNEEFSSAIKALEQELENKEKELLAQVQEPKPPTVTEGEPKIYSIKNQTGLTFTNK